MRCVFSSSIPLRHYRSWLLHIHHIMRLLDSQIKMDILSKKIRKTALILRFDLRFYELRYSAATNHAVYYALHIVVAEAIVYHYQVAIFKMLWIYAARFE